MMRATVQPQGRKMRAPSAFAGSMRRPATSLVLAHLLRLAVLGLEVPHLLAAGVVDAADDAQGIEDEPGPGVALHPSGEELNVLDTQALEELDEAAR